MNHADHSHLIRHGQLRFPTAHIEVTFPKDEVIHMKVDDRLFVFEIGSDDDYYIFSDGIEIFTIPLMDEDFRDFP